MELVLWRPPSDFIQHVYNLKTDSHNEENNQVSCVSYLTTVEVFALCTNACTSEWRCSIRQRHKG